MSCDKSDGNENGDTPHESINLKSGLVLYYTFDEGTQNLSVQTITDYSNSNVGGVINGSPSFVSDTPNGKGHAIRLGLDDYINIPKFTVQGMLDVTINVWVKDFTRGWLIASLKSNIITSPSIGINNSDLLLYLSRNSNITTAKNIFSKSFLGFQSNGWHMITVTSEYVGSTQSGAQGALESKNIASLYIDGVLIDSQRIWQDKCAGESMIIGPEAAPMTIDNVRVYNRALDEGEVKELYNTERR